MLEPRPCCCNKEILLGSVWVLTSGNKAETTTKLYSTIVLVVMIVIVVVVLVVVLVLVIPIVLPITSPNSSNKHLPGYIGLWNFWLLLQRRRDLDTFDPAVRLLVPLLIFTSVIRMKSTMLALLFFGLVAVATALLLCGAGVVMVILMLLASTRAISGDGNLTV